MAFLLASAFRVQYPGEGQLTVVDPPTLWFAVLCYAFALIGLLVLLGSFKTRSRGAALCGLCIVLLCGFGGWVASSASSATIDKQTGVVVFHSGWLRSTYELPLNEVKYATVETSNAAYRLVFVMGDGHRQGLSSYSDKGGQPEAAHAINQFLGVNDPN